MAITRELAREICWSDGVESIFNDLYKGQANVDKNEWWGMAICKITHISEHNWYSACIITPYHMSGDVDDESRIWPSIQLRSMDTDIKVGEYYFVHYKEHSRREDSLFAVIRYKVGSNMLTRLSNEYLPELESLETIKESVRELEQEHGRLSAENTRLVQESQSKLQDLEHRKSDLENQTAAAEKLLTGLHRSIQRAEMKKTEYKKLGWIWDDKLWKEEAWNGDGQQVSSRSYSEWVAKIMESDQREEFFENYRRKGQRILDRFLSALLTNQLIILSGPSGTGKTTLPQYVAKVLGGECRVISVQPNWTDHQDLLGYYNFVNDSYVGTEFLDVLMEAKNHPETLYIAVLDEMNLAHVEYYFAKYLSAMELQNPVIYLYSRRVIDAKLRSLMQELELICETDEACRQTLEAARKTYEEKHSRQSVSGDEEVMDDYLQVTIAGRDNQTLEDYLDHFVHENEQYKNWHSRYKRFLSESKVYPPEVEIPSNLQIVGTINMDATTKGLSPKILDRSYVIEIADDGRKNTEEIVGNYLTSAGSDKVKHRSETDIIEYVRGFIDRAMAVQDSDQMIMKMSRRQEEQMKRILKNLESMAPGVQEVRGIDTEALVDDLILSKLLPAAYVQGQMIEESSHRMIVDGLKTKALNGISFSDFNSIEKLDNMYDSTMSTYDYWRS